MNIITTLPQLNWRPLLAVPEPHVSAFEEWRATQAKVNERVQQCKSAAFSLDERARVENEIMPSALLASDMHERLAAIVGGLLREYGWDAYDAFVTGSVYWRLKNNHPWPDDDDTPIMRPEEYQASISTNNPADIIAALSQVPPKWLSPKLVEVHAGAGVVRFECGG